MRDRVKWVGGHVAAVVVVLLAVAYIVRPSPHIPPYDANLVRLAETERQGYCAGLTFWQSQGEGDATLAAECRATHREESGRVNLAAAEKGFCRGVVDSGWDGDSVADCVAILAAYRYWPTYDGSITDQWNRARPYPRPAIAATEGQDESRTGGREYAPQRGPGTYRGP